MDKLDLMNAYEMVEQVKTYLAESPCKYEITGENASDDSLFICWKSANGKDGLPMYLYKGGDEKGGSTFEGEYQLVFDIQRNSITFWYLPAGYGKGSLSSCYVGVDANGRPTYKEIKNKIGIMSLEKEWNDNFQKHVLGLHSYAYKDKYGATLAFAFSCEWLFNEGDSFDAFKNEFKITMSTCQSKEMADFISNKIFQYMIPGKSL